MTKQAQMTIINSVISWFMKKRMHQLELFMKYPHDVQEEWFRRLILSARNTEWVKNNGTPASKTMRLLPGVFH
jgi:hypothetical protein